MATDKWNYGEKLKDPRWQKKRLKILERDQWTCQQCGDTETTLHIHHSSYAGDPWEVADEELTTLCEHCHSLTDYDSLKAIGAKVKKIKVPGNTLVYFFKYTPGIAIYVKTEMDAALQHRTSLNYDILRELFEFSGIQSD